MTEAKERLRQALASPVVVTQDAWASVVADAIEALIDARIAAERTKLIRDRSTPERTAWWDAIAKAATQAPTIAVAEPPAGRQGRCDCGHDPDYHFEDGVCAVIGCDYECTPDEPEPEPPTPPSAGPIEDAIEQCEWLLGVWEAEGYDFPHRVKAVRSALAALNATAPAEGGRSDTERFDWFFGPANKIEAMGEYFVGVQNKWSLGEWRAFCDRWMNAARAAEGKS